MKTIKNCGINHLDVVSIEEVELNYFKINLIGYDRN